jgi:hypothetical protein
MANIPTRPVVGWSSHVVADSAILLGLKTVGSEDQLAGVMAGRTEPDITPALLTPAQCLELADALTRHARRLLEQPTPPRSRQS